MGLASFSSSCRMSVSQGPFFWAGKFSREESYRFLDTSLWQGREWGIPSVFSLLLLHPQLCLEVCSESRKYISSFLPAGQRPAWQRELGSDAVAYTYSLSVFPSVILPWRLPSEATGDSVLSPFVFCIEDWLVLCRPGRLLSVFYPFALLSLRVTTTYLRILTSSRCSRNVRSFSWRMVTLLFHFLYKGTFPVAQTVKNLPVMRETQVWFLGREDPLEKGMATYSSILAWRIPWTKEPGGPQSMGSQRAGHNWATDTLTQRLRACHYMSCFFWWWSRRKRAT